MRAELGSKAVILHSKKYKESGLLGLRTKEVVEITAAVEDSPEKNESVLDYSSGFRYTVSVCLTGTPSAAYAMNREIAHAVR